MDKEFAEAFEELRHAFRHKTQRNFIDAIEGEIADRTELQEVLGKRRASPRYVSVTFDRRPNDTTFSYSYFDLMLVILDRLAGGRGIYKPVSQVRALRWNNSRPSLLTVLRALRRMDPRLNFRRVLILPFPIPPIGAQIDVGIYRK